MRWWRQDLAVGTTLVIFVGEMTRFRVITDIGFDHMHILGDTLTAIASQKAGIIAAR